MSDVIATVTIENRVLVLTDFDRPVWTLAGSPRLGLVPSPDHVLVDAILAFAGDRIDGIDPERARALQRGARACSLEDYVPAAELAEARRKVYAATGPGVLCVFAGGREQWLSDDLQRLAMPTAIAEAPSRSLEFLR
jgi:hypothetical protein